MYLTRDEERIYDGELGWAYQVAIRILVKLGDLYGAERLIPIESAHISGVSYKTIGDTPIEFLRALAESGAKTSIRATTNPSGVDPTNDLFKTLSKEIIERQLEITSLYGRMGFDLTLTCTPYYLKRPASGSHLSWAESSAVIYANSLLNAWTNREGGPSALASALIGKTPNYGLHRPENRLATVMVKVETELRSEADYGALGIYLGRILGDRIPVICGRVSRSEYCLKQLGAAMATSGMVSMFYLEGGWGSPETIEEKILVDERSIKASYESLISASERPDLVFIGCPHCSPDELKTIAGYLRGKRVQRGIKLWVCTSRWARTKFMDYVRAIEESGGQVICDTCAVVTWLKELGVGSILTNSAKTAYYAPLLSRVKAKLASLEDCIRTALGN